MSHQKTVRVVAASEYGAGRDGFLIEMLHAGGQPECLSDWTIPAWEEWGMCHLEGPFATAEAAQAAISQ